MKKIYLSILCLSAFGITSFGQVNRQFSELKVRGTEEMRKSVKPSNTNVEKATPLWSSDFSVGADWVMANTSAPTPGNWVISTSTATTIGYGTGAWADAAAVSDENGYALFDSDAVGGTGGAQNATITYAGTINLSAYAALTIDFRQRVRKFTTTETFVGVSTDGGMTWTNYPVNVTLASGVVRERTESINITNSAGSQASVKIRFQYIGAWDYLWAVDDVAIYEQPANDVQILSAYCSGSTNEGIEYGRTIINHLDASYLVGLEAYNFGTDDQTNVAGDADYTAFTSMFSFGTIVAGDTVILENTETPTLTVGAYPGLFSLVSDLETAGDYFGNNTFNRPFAVTQNEYSQDGIGVYNAADLQVTSLGTNSFTGGEDGLRMAAMYHIKQTDDFWALKVMLANGTDPGSYVIASILDTGLFLLQDFTPIATSVEYFVTAADITAGFIVVPFTSMATLGAGAYYASIQCYSDAGATDIRVLDDQTVAQPGAASMIFIPGGANPGVYSNGIALGIRLLAGTAGIGQNELEGVTIYPNPSTGLVNISNDSNTENTITVLDLTGKTVATKVVSSATQLDLSSVGTGVYFIEISNTNGKKVERVVIR